MEEWVSQKWRNLYQNKVDKETKGVVSRDKVKRRLTEGVISYF